MLMTSNRAWAQKAPVLILTLAHTLWEKERTPNRLGFHDLGLATANRVIQATSLGLATRQMGGFDIEAARERFGVRQASRLGACKRGRLRWAIRVSQNPYLSRFASARWRSAAVSRLKILSFQGVGDTRLQLQILLALDLLENKDRVAPIRGSPWIHADFRVGLRGTSWFADPFRSPAAGRRRSLRNSRDEFGRRNFMRGVRRSGERLDVVSTGPAEGRPGAAAALPYIP